MAVEIHDKAINDLLAAKLQATETPAAKLLPKQMLRLSHRLPQLARALTLFRRHCLLCNEAVLSVATHALSLAITSPRPLPGAGRGVRTAGHWVTRIVVGFL